MKPGIHYNVPSDDYFAFDAVSNSYLGKIAKCPAAAKVEQETTPAMAFGSAAHKLILEGYDAFDEEYAVQPNFGDLRKKENKAKKEKWLETVNGRIIISGADYKTIKGMMESVRNVAGHLIESGDAEVTLVWDEFGTLCKSRVDFVSADGIFIDLKTTDDASPKAFSNSVSRYGYDRQAGMYLAGASANDIHISDFLFIAVEKKPPYRCEVYTLCTEWLDRGFSEFYRLLDIHRDCVAADNFPNNICNGEVIELKKPSWLGA